MPSSPTMLPATVYHQFAIRAVQARIEVASETDAAAPEHDRHRLARLKTAHALRRDAADPGDPLKLDGSGSQKLRQGLDVLIGAAEDVAHGALGEITDIGIETAQRRLKCRCGPTFVRVLKLALDTALSAAAAGLRSAIRL